MRNEAAGPCPPEVLEWIAWYPDGELTAAQRGAVEAHAAGCASCREEIAMIAGRVEAPVSPADPERLFARVLALVEADGLATVPAAPPAATPSLRGSLPLHRRRSVWAAAGPRLAASAALILLVGGLGGWLGRDWVAGPARGVVYAPASEPATAPPEGVVALDVVFRSDATAERIQTALRGLRAELVAGPSPLGRYRVELPPGSDASAAAALLRAEGTGVASFAEPLRP